MIALLLVAALGFAEIQAAPQAQTPAPTGTISGVVRMAESNTPLAGAVVHLNRTDVSFDPSTLATDLNRKPTISKSNEYGRFSFASLPAGKYSLWIEEPPEFVWADRRIYDGGVRATVDPLQRSEEIVFRLSPRGSISGRVLNVRGEPLVGAGVLSVCVLYREGKRNLEGCGGGSVITDQEGNYRLFWLTPGKYYVRTEYHPSTDDNPPLVYFPGTLDEAQATFVEVKPGSELTGIDFSLVTPPVIPGYTVSGRVVGLPAAVANKPIEFLHLFGNVGPSSRTDNSYPNTAGDISAGQFQIRGVRSGTYELWTQVRDESGLTYTALSTVEVAGANIENLVVTVAPMVDLHGRILIEGKPPETPFSPGATPPQITPIDFPSEYALYQLQYQSKGIQFNRDTGEFTILRVPPGRYKVMYFPSNLPNGYVADVRQGSQSISDGFTISGDTPQPIEIMSSSPGGTVNGVAVGADLSPIFGATVAIASAANAGKNIEWHGAVKTDKEGHFSMSRLAPGEYQVYAFINPPDGAPWMNPDYLRRYELLGQTFRVNAGTTTTVRITPIPEDK